MSVASKNNFAAGFSVRKEQEVLPALCQDFTFGMKPILVKRWESIFLENKKVLNFPSAHAACYAMTAVCVGAGPGIRAFI